MDIKSVKSENYSQIPQFISVEDFLSQNSDYVNETKFNWGKFTKIISIYISLFFITLSIVFCVQRDVNEDFLILLMLGIFILFFVLFIAIAISTPTLWLKRVYDIEETTSKYKIVRAHANKMGIYAFLKNKVEPKAVITFDKIVNLGDESFLLENGNKKGVLNLLSGTAVWIHPMDVCEISCKDGIITVSKGDKFVKRITTRGFKL